MRIRRLSNKRKYFLFQWVGLFFGFFIAIVLKIAILDRQPTEVVFVGKSNIIFF